MIIMYAQRRKLKMILYDTECADCKTGCLAMACPYYMIEICTCDDCNKEFMPEDLYVYSDGRMLCKDCLAQHFKTVRKAKYYYDFK